MSPGFGVALTNLQTVAAGSDEMGTSIREISHSANEGARVANQAVDAASSTADTMKRVVLLTRPLGFRRSRTNGASFARFVLPFVLDRRAGPPQWVRNRLLGR